MKTNALAKVLGLILLATAVSLVMLALVYTLHHSQMLETLATVSWNG